MKIKIKKKGKQKTYKLISSWSEVTLEKWIKLAELEGLSKSEEAKGVIELLSDIPNTVINKLALADISTILNRVAYLQSNPDNGLKKVIKVDGEEYGFHPNLEDITLGEWADLEHYIKAGIEKNLPHIMSILYRPIVERESDAYIIKAYDGNIDVRAEKLKKMKAENVESCLVFFWHFVSALLVNIPLSLAKPEETQVVTPNKLLEKSGATLD